MQTGTAPLLANVRLILAGENFEPGNPRLDEADRARWSALRSAARRHTFLAAREMLSTRPSGSATSLAHSGYDSVVAWCDGSCRLGVDIERVRDRDVLRLAEFSFAPAEARELRNLPDADRLPRFYELWVLKEACAKALQVPLLQALRQFEFSTERMRYQGLTRSVLLQVLEPEPGLMIGLAVEAEALALHCSTWPEPVAAPWPARLSAVIQPGA